MEYIDNYFASIPTPEIKKEFEDKIHNDPLFAEDVAFYLSAQKAIKENAESSKQRFKEIYAEYRQNKPLAKRPAMIRKLWPYIAAAAVITGLIFGLNTWLKTPSVPQLADVYMQGQFKKLGVTMSSKEDSLQTGIRLYNHNNPEQALLQFESIIHNDASSAEAIKYAGIAALELGNYEKALKYFVDLENYPGLHVNPGKFYHAITLMKRGQKGDKETAKQLLTEVDQYNLEGKNQAREWLRKF